MFDLKNFVVNNIVNGVKNGTFAKEYGNIMAVNYLAKGILTEENIITIDERIASWEASQIVIEETTEENNIEETEEISDEVVEEIIEETAE